jgi:hypothetical protein
MGLPNASFPRIDALVLRFDANKNGAELVSKQGTASSDPKPPEVSRTGAYHELHLLHVRRNAGAAVISAADVTDLRLNEQYCGLMADPVTRVDTEAINAQVTELIQKLRDDLQNVKDQDYYASKEYVKDTVTEAVKEAAPYNYVNNSDFTQFVAQTGIGGNHGTQAYAGDRWILDSGTVTGDAREDGNGYTNVTLNGTIRQSVANAPDVGTAAIEMVSGTAQIFYADGQITITSNGGVIKNVALYDGNFNADNQPKYQPKGYGAELAECMRYYQSIAVNSNLYLANTNDFRCNCLYSVRMRILPTISITVSSNGVSTANVTKDSVNFFSASPGYVTAFNASADL